MTVLILHEIHPATGTEEAVALEPVSEAPYYQLLLRRLEGLGKTPPDEITRRGFGLTDAALCARESADSGESLFVRPGPWHARSHSS